METEVGRFQRHCGYKRDRTGLTTRGLMNEKEASRMAPLFLDYTLTWIHWVEEREGGSVCAGGARPVEGIYKSLLKEGMSKMLRDIKVEM